MVVLTDLDGGAQRLVRGDDRSAGDPVTDEEWALCDRALRDDRSERVVLGERSVFVHVLNPPLWMVIVGAVHITQALAPMARLTGYRVTVIDPRRAFASEARFPDVEVLTDWPDEAMEALGLGRRSAVVTLTHDPKIDDPALAAALRSEAFYIGSLGSRRTHAARLERLRQAGFSDADLARIHGPLGLPIGAKSPAEIALSALSEVTRTLRQPVPAGTGTGPAGGGGATR